MLTTWDQRVRRDKHQADAGRVPGPDHAGTTCTTGSRRPSRRPRRFCTSATSRTSRASSSPCSASAGWRASGASSRSSTAPTPWHSSPSSCANSRWTTTGSASTSGCSRRPETGLAVRVRKDRIAKTWPLQATPASQDNDVKKFEATGTYPAGIRAALAEALAFHQAIGIERKAARLRYLTLRWANKLNSNPRVLIHTGLDQVYGVACVGIKDIPASRINAFMWDKYRIITTAINRPEYNGIRVTPNIYTPLEEIDTFTAAMEDLLKNGLPATA